MGRNSEHLKSQKKQFLIYLTAYLLTAMIVILVFAKASEDKAREEREKRLDYGYSYRSSSSYSYTTTTRQTTTAPATTWSKRSDEEKRRDIQAWINANKKKDESEIDILDEDYLDAWLYDDPEEFYEDNKDEFDNEDEAYDYWYEMNE